MNHNELIEILERQQHYPDIKPEHFNCKMLANNNQQYYADLHETEVELHKFFLEIKHKLNQSELSKLKVLIDNYGQRKYEEGIDSNID